jgi:ribosome maturation factor RimP
MKDMVIERVWEIAEPLVTHEGLEIVDIEYRRESRGMVLRLFLDRAGGSGPENGGCGVSLDDLTRVSRQLGDLFDVHETVPGTYMLEVSSPGINRRLRSADHFKRFLGKRVRVRTAAPIDGRRVFAGALDAVEADGISVADRETNHFIPFAEIAQANYEPEVLSVGTRR